MTGGMGSPLRTRLTPPQDQEGSAESGVIMEGQVKFTWPGGEGSWRRWLIIRASKKMGHLAHEAEGGKGHRMTSDM